MPKYMQCKTTFSQKSSHAAHEPQQQACVFIDIDTTTVEMGAQHRAPPQCHKHPCQLN